MPLRRQEFQLTSVVGFRGPGRGGTGSRTGTPPTVSSVTVAADGVTVTVVTNVATTGWANGQATLVGTTASVLNYTSGTGTTSIVFTAVTTIHTGNVETMTLGAAATGLIIDTRGNAMLTFTGQAVTNNSAQP